MVVLGEIAPLAKHGGNRKPEHGQADNISLKGYGTDTEYTLRRLKRDAPEFAKVRILTFDPLMTLEVIPAADHFQIDVEVIGSLPASGQWSRGCGGQWSVVPIVSKTPSAETADSATRAGVATPATMIFQAFSELFENAETA